MFPLCEENPDGAVWGRWWWEDGVGKQSHASHRVLTEGALAKGWPSAQLQCEGKRSWGDGGVEDGPKQLLIFHH